jgi:hypothetical protein
MKFRIKDEEQSEALQNVLFKLGYSWNGKYSIDHNMHPFLCNIYQTSAIEYGDTEHYFEWCVHTEKDTAQFIKQHTKEIMKDNVNLVPHKHQEVIIAWAEGAEIEFESILDGWVPLSASPMWDKSTSYRVKPAIPERVFPVTKLTEHDFEECVSNSPAGCNDVLVHVANEAIKQYILDCENT